ncbi:MAG: FecR domain-containing protein [Pseudomonadota bacterium]
MAPKDNPIEDTPEQAAESISDALDFLRGEADAAGMSDVSDLLREASTKSREHSVMLSSETAGDTQPAALEQDPAVIRIRRPWHRPYLPLAAAAGAAATVFAFLLWSSPEYEATFQTVVGQHQEIRLPDESVLTLNTDSQVTVVYTDTERRVHLERGEVHFDVTPAPARPFKVAAGSGTVRAVGTAFNVYLKNELVEVTVAEGIVEVQANGTSLPATEILNEGQRLEYSDTIESVSTVDPDEITRKLAWQDGMLDFEENTLAEVIAEAGRYTSTRITIVDPDVEDLPVTAYIRAGDVDKLLERLASTGNVSVQRVGSQEVHIAAAPAAN